MLVVPTLDKEAGTATANAGAASAGCVARPFVVHDKEEGGFTGAANIGFQIATPWEDLCLLNDDVMAFSLGWLATLQAVMYSSDDIGIVAPSGASLSTPSRGRPGESGLIAVNSVPFWCVLIRAELREELGGLDTEFIHYSSDTWYCWQARHAGWRIIWARAVYLWHEHQASGYRRKWHAHDTRLLRQKVRAHRGEPWANMTRRGA